MSFTSFFHLLWNGCSFYEETQDSYPVLHNFKKCEIDLDKQNIILDIAETETEQELGLSFRKKLDRNEGMLFLSQNNSPMKFHTKKVHFDICIVFLDDQNLVLSTQILRPNDEITTPNHTHSILELSSLYCSSIKKDQLITLCEGEWD